MKAQHLILTILFTLTTILAQAAPPPPPPGGKGKGKGGPGGSESAEMTALLKSFNLTQDQQDKYAAKKKTSDDMQKIHVGKENGTLPMDDVLKQALASHKAFNAAVKEILSADQYAKWEPLREADHHKIAAAHKARDEAAAKIKI